MDKRHYLYTRIYRLSDGRDIPVKFYQKSTNRGMTCRMVYGEMEMYVSSYTRIEDADRFVSKCIGKRPEHIIDRPYYKDRVYYYILGKKRYYTEDVIHKDDPSYFYVLKNTKDPLNVYQKRFLLYLNDRVPLLAKRMGLDIKGWVIRTGLFLSYYGVCFPTKHILKFDYRLFSYKAEISDAIIYHELAHILDIHHDDRFYKIVKMYCPDYDELESQIEKGYFEGRLDYYGL